MKKILVLVPLLLVTHFAFAAQNFTTRPMSPAEVAKFSQNIEQMMRSFAQSKHSKLVDVEKTFAQISTQVMADGKEIRAKAKAGVPGYVYSSSTMDASGKRTFTEQYGNEHLKAAPQEMSSARKSVLYGCASLALAGLGYLVYQALVG